MARFRRNNNVRYIIGDTWPSQQRGTGQQMGQIPLRMDVTKAAGALFSDDPLHEGKTLLLDITIVNFCVSTDFKTAVRQTENPLTDEVERKKNKYRGSLPATYPFLHLSMWTYGDLGADVYAVIRSIPANT